MAGYASSTLWTLWTIVVPRGSAQRFEKGAVVRLDHGLGHAAGSEQDVEAVPEHRVLDRHQVVLVLDLTPLGLELLIDGILWRRSDAGKASGIPLTTDVGTHEGPMWGVALADRPPVRLDLWDTAAGFPAPHLVIVSPTGGGKTVPPATW
jgi:hypothetical protein